MISTAAHSECVRLLDLLTNERMQKAYSHRFMNTNTSTEPQNVKKPMDLNTVRKNLGGKPSRCRFKSHEKFAKDVRLVFQNAAVCYNSDTSEFQAAQYLLQVFEAAYNTAKANLQRFEEDQSAANIPEDSTQTAHSPNPHSIPAPVSKSPVIEMIKKKKKRYNKPETVMTEAIAADCKNILAKIMRYRETNITLAAPFLQPVDIKHFPDYVIKIPKRMHLYGVQKKLKSGSYRTLDEFAADMRLIFSNCLIYNSDVVLSRVIRSHAITLMKLFESELQKQCNGSWPGISERWQCHQILHDILAHRSRTKSLVDGKEFIHEPEETAQWFKYPIQTYYDSPELMPHQYFDIVRQPMDLGTVSGNLHEPVYRYPPEFAFNIKRIFDNCAKYWGHNPHGKAYCDSATALTNVLHEQLLKHFGSTDWITMLFGHESISEASLIDLYKTHMPATKPSSPKNEVVISKPRVADRIIKPVKEELKKKKLSTSASASSFFPEKNQCMAILEKLKSHRVKGYNGIEIMTAGPFLHAVDVTKYPDYPKIIAEPMDFTKIERKIKNERYKKVHEFAADVDLVISNCMKYNNDPVEGADIRTMATTLQDFFHKSYMETFHNGEKLQHSCPQPLQPIKVATSSDVRCGKSEVRLGVNLKEEITKPSSPIQAANAVLSLSKCIKQPDDHSLPLMQGQLQTRTESQLGLTESEDLRKLMKKEKKKKKKRRKESLEKDKELGTSKPPIPDRPQSSSNHPVAQIQEMPQALVQSETMNRKASFSKKSKKNSNDLAPWEYACDRVWKKIAKTESLTKVHASQPFLPTLPPTPMTHIPNITDTSPFRTLHAQLRTHSIQTPQEFISKARAAFENAIKSFNTDDPTSLHAQEMTQHLLWYFNSLCAEQALLSEAPDQCQNLRRDRELTIRSLPLEIKARECQKLLRGLQSQKYQKNSWPFQKPVKALFPYLEADYFEMIKNPMDLATIQDKLNSLEYATYGDFIRDVRLVFENAILYNRADQEREGWSVYKAAVFMLKVIDDLWGNVTVEVLEKIKRKKVIWKERERLAELKRKEELARKEEEDALEAKANAARALVASNLPVADSGREELVKQVEAHAVKVEPARSMSSGGGAFAGATVTVAPSLTSGNTRLKLQVIARPNGSILTPDRALNKVERKAEEKRRKRARKEEEYARKEKRHRTAIAATDDALREAEARSFRRLQRLALEKAMQLREERERQAKEMEKSAQLKEKRNFKELAWKEMNMKQGSSFWRKKHKKLATGNIFQDPVHSQ